MRKFYLAETTLLRMEAMLQYSFFSPLKTRLHENECQRRTSATIATHDMSAIKLPLTYKAMRPSIMKVSVSNYS